MEIIRLNDVIDERKRNESYQTWYMDGMDVLSKIDRDDAGKIVDFVIGYLLGRSIFLNRKGE